MNKYSLWKISFSLSYFLSRWFAIPVLFGNQPAIQVSNATAGMDVSRAVLQQVTSALDATYFIKMQIR